MVLVDTSVWIDFFAGRDRVHVAQLETLIRDGRNLALCGIILTEILQGIRDDAVYTLTETRLRFLILLPMCRNTFLLAAQIYRSLRKHGVTVRKPVDCMIAAVAIENSIPLLHNDRGFLSIAKHHPLMFWQWPKYP
jgi:predicted nucleic acid-binding protein